MSKKRLCVILRCTSRSRKLGIYWAFWHQISIFWNKKIHVNRPLKRVCSAFIYNSSTYAPVTLCCAEEAVANDRENGNTIENILWRKWVLPFFVHRLSTNQVKKWYFTDFSPASWAELLYIVCLLRRLFQGQAWANFGARGGFASERGARARGLEASTARERWVMGRKNRDRAFTPLPVSVSPLVPRFPQ